MRLVHLALALVLLSPGAAALPGESLALTLGELPPARVGEPAVAPVTVEYCYPAQFAAASNGPTHVHLSAKIASDFSQDPTGRGGEIGDPNFGQASVTPTTVDFPVSPGAQNTCGKASANLTVTLQNAPPQGLSFNVVVSGNADANGVLQGGSSSTKTPLVVAPPPAASNATGDAPAPTPASKFMGLDKDLAYFLLGLLVTLGGALFGVWRLRSKRGRLKALLRAADETAAKLAHDALACEDELQAQRRAAKQLLLDGRLDEGQWSVLDAHLAKLQTHARRHAVDQELPFLPPHVVKDLNDVLGDGRMSHSEHRRLAAAVRALDLAPDEMARALALFDAWAQRDNAAAHEHERAATPPSASPRGWLRR